MQKWGVLDRDGQEERSRQGVNVHKDLEGTSMISTWTPATISLAPSVRGVVGEKGKKRLWTFYKGS